MWAQFYHTYSKWKGFRIRVDNVRKDSNKVVWQRRWVCSREGFRRQQWLELENIQKAPKAITRVGCKAFLKITLDREKVCGSHHHSTHTTIMNWLRPMKLNFFQDINKSRILCLCKQNRCVILGYAQWACWITYHQQYGGRDRLPFLHKDIYNKLGEERWPTKIETDSDEVLGYLTCLAIRDGHFFSRLIVDEEATHDFLVQLYLSI